VEIQTQIFGLMIQPDPLFVNRSHHISTFPKRPKHDPDAEIKSTITKLNASFYGFVSKHFLYEAYCLENPLTAVIAHFLDRTVKICHSTFTKHGEVQEHMRRLSIHGFGIGMDIGLESVIPHYLSEAKAIVARCPRLFELIFSVGVLPLPYAATQAQKAIAEEVAKLADKHSKKIRVTFVASTVGRSNGLVK